MEDGGRFLGNSLIVLGITTLSLLPSPFYLLSEDLRFHIVIKGDTLWHISGKYLGNPLRWKAVWNLNKETVRNPDLIFPNQKIVWSEAKSKETESLSQPVLKEEMVTAEKENPEEIAISEQDAIPEEELPAEKLVLPVLIPSPGLVVQPKSDQPTLLTNLKQQEMKDQGSTSLGKISADSEKTLFEKGDEVPLRFYKSQNFAPGTLLLVARWKESLLTIDGEMALASESKYLDYIGIVEVTENMTPTKSIANPIRLGKVIEMSDFLTPGDLLREFPQ